MLETHQTLRIPLGYAFDFRQLDSRLPKSHIRLSTHCGYITSSHGAAVNLTIRWSEGPEGPLDSSPRGTAGCPEGSVEE